MLPRAFLFILFACSAETIHYHSNAVVVASHENRRVKRWGPSGYGPFSGGGFPGRGFRRRNFRNRGFPGGGFSSGGFPRGGFSSGGFPGGGFPIGGGGAFPGAGLLSSFASGLDISANLRVAGFNNGFLMG